MMSEGQSEILLESGTNEVEVLEFKIHMKSGRWQSFGINVAKVREIIVVPSFDEIPNSHPSIKGVFQLRNKVIPLIDLSAYLGADASFDLKDAKVIVAEFNNQNFGFLIPEVETIHRFSWKNVLSPSKVVIDIDQVSVVAVIPMKDRTMFMIDFEKVVSDINPESGIDMDSAKDDMPGPGADYKPLLIVDDSAVVRDMLTKVLTEGGFKLKTFTNGQDAWDYLQELKSSIAGSDIHEHLDLVITDIEMPKMDGHTLCKQIKTDSVLQKLPVILFSSLIYSELRKKGDAVGADGQISKPELGSLVRLTKELIQQYRDGTLNSE